MLSKFLSYSDFKNEGSTTTFNKVRLCRDFGYSGTHFVSCGTEFDSAVMDWESGELVFMPQEIKFRFQLQPLKG
jgi:hypothetical protein